MNGYSSLEVFTEHDKKCARAAHLVVMNLPDKHDGDQCEWVRCHEVARIVAKMIESPGVAPAKVVDGHYGSVHHSWIVLPSTVILDCYSVGRLPVVQLVTTMGVAYPDLYRPAKAPRDDIRQDFIDEWVKRLHDRGMVNIFAKARDREDETGHW